MTTCTYAFIADISGPEYRAMRMGFMSLTIFVSYPIAMALGGFIYEKGGLENYDIQRKHDECEGF